GRSVRSFQEEMDRQLAARSADTGTELRMEMVARRHDATASNILALWLGSDPALSEETIILGAHHDHFGIQAGLVFPGADDNASGSAVLLEIARVLATNGIRPKRSLLFLSFAGEEQGLLGSRFYVAHPPYPLSAAKAMINVDHAGVGNGHIVVGLSKLEKATAQAAAEKAAAGDKLELYGLFPGGDHVPFAEAGLPTAAIVKEGQPHPEKFTAIRCLADNLLDLSEVRRIRKLFKHARSKLVGLVGRVSQHRVLRGLLEVNSCLGTELGGRVGAEGRRYEALKAGPLLIDDRLILGDGLFGRLNQLRKQFLGHLGHVGGLEVGQIDSGPFLELPDQLLFEHLRCKALVTLFGIVDERLVGPHRDPTGVQKNRQEPAGFRGVLLRACKRLARGRYEPGKNYEEDGDGQSSYHHCWPPSEKVMDENGLSRAGEWGRTTALLITNCVKSHVPLEWQALAVCRLQ